MYCKNCGNQIIEGTSFCPKCGSQIEQTNNNQNVNMNNNVQYQNNIVYNQTINNQITDEDLKRAYIGEKYDSFKNGGASIFPFLLGAIYLLYRKMYLWGLAWIIINFVCSVVPALGIVSLIVMILMIAKVKEFYMKHVEKKINQIKLENPTASKEQLINICSKKGGVNIVVPIVIGSVIFLMVSFACVATPIILNTIEENREESNSTTNENEENSDIISIKLVDPSTETIDKCSETIDEAKYFKKQSDGVYVANVTLGQLNAAYDESDCQYSDGVLSDGWSFESISDDPDKLLILLQDKIDGEKILFEKDLNNKTANGFSQWYIFDNSYLVDVNPYGHISIYDFSGQSVYDFNEAELDLFVEDDKITYSINCDPRYIDYYNNETAIFGELKYNKTTKEFIREETEKSVDYCYSAN